MKPRSTALLYLVSAAMLWSTGGVLIKWVPWNGLAICGARSAVTALMYWAILRRPRFNWSIAQIGGAVAYAATVLLYVSAVKMTTAANAILLQYSAPVWVALFGAWFLKERATWVDWLSVVAVFGGMLLFFRDGLRSVSLWGDLLAFFSSITIAWMTLFLRKQKDGSPLESMLLGNILAAGVGLPFTAMELVWGHMPGVWGWVDLGVLGVLQVGLSYVLFTAAIKHVTALEAMLVSTLEPILNPVWAALLIGERPGPFALVGGLVVVLAITARATYAALTPSRPTRPVAGQAP